MKIIFNNKYLAMLAAFVAKQDVRHYLNGFHVKPHPEQGVILTATDGHTLVTIHDAEGVSDGEYIFPISKALLSAANGKQVPSYRMTTKNVVIIDGIAMVTGIDDIQDWLNDFEDINEHAVRDLVTYLEFINPIDGKFPNAGGLFKCLDQPKPVSQIAISPELFSRLIKLKHNRHAGANFCFYGDKSACVAVMGADREIVVMMMPMRLDEVDRASLPDFADICGHQPPAKSESLDNTPTTAAEKSSAA
ncbi:hypothetical protein G3495_10855 [Shewanella baltica]|uniref:hypothetical protein n=1 Tax=Shewanella baltica TaxID=62322 RepID=UPI00217E3460|nr:hypothetical protein [Shewanella baltica]MCS6235620.1 hypothetical protein [Shewanella baltica]MCS6270217.1 hypothetical protein [Shewanella baltica]